MAKVRHKLMKALTEMSSFSKIDVREYMAFFTSELTINLSMFDFHS